MVHGKFQKKAWLLLFFSVAWSLWLLRNDLIFQQKSPNYDSVFFLIITRLCLWLKALHPDFPYSPSDLLRSAEGLIRWSNVQITRTDVTWSPPTIDSFKWNVDGSSLGKPGLSGYGCTESSSPQFRDWLDFLAQLLFLMCTVRAIVWQIVWLSRECEDPVISLLGFDQSLSLCLSGC